VTRAAFYIRVSTEKQAREGYSLPSQLRALREAATARGYVVADGAEFVDAYSAKTADDRRQLGRLRAAAQRGDFDVVLTLHPDRFGRDLLDALLVRKELRTIGVPLEYVSIRTDYSPSGIFTEQIFGAVAQLERSMILERTSRGRREKARQGRVLSGPVPLGYVRDPTAPSGLAIDETGAQWVRRIFGWICDGASLTAVRRRLTAQGCPSPRGGAWAHTTLQELVKREVYTGTWWYNRRTGGSSSRTFRARDEWIGIPVPPIISQATFDRAQAQVRRHRSTHGRPAQHVYLAGGGLLTCGQCGRKLRGDVEHGTTLVYRCSGRRSDAAIAGLPRCRFRVLARQVDPALWTVVAEQVRATATQRRLLPDVLQADARSELGDLERAARRLAAQRDRLLDLHVSGRIDRARFDAKDAPLAAEETQVQGERARVAALVASGQVVADQQAAALAHARLLVRNLDGLDDRQRRELVRRWVTSVVVHPDGLDVKGLFPRDAEAPERGCELVATLR
jgi:site-specific DNA recombinase